MKGRFSMFSKLFFVSLVFSLTVAASVTAFGKGKSTGTVKTVKAVAVKSQAMMAQQKAIASAKPHKSAAVHKITTSSKSRKPAALSKSPVAKKKTKQAVAYEYWQEQFEALKKKQFKSAVEVMNAATKFQNRIALHEDLTHAQKKSLRRQVHKFEGARSAQFPPPRLVGFKRTYNDPNDTSKGYSVEPMYQ